MDKCFVIQPFDNGKYDSRFTDVFAPAIVKAGLQPYRVDKDPTVRIPIDDIEKGISESVICFAEITSDNPNVWYELGFAFACGKDVVMVCSDERQGKFPFDIQHRLVVTYKTGSKSDFEKLEDAITNKIAGLMTVSKTVEKLSTTPVVETEGLKSHEIALLILIMENQISENDYTFVHILKDEMNKSGYTSIATNVGIRTLTVKNLIDVLQDGRGYSLVRLTDLGINWILDNQQLLQFRIGENKNNDNNLPF